MAIIKEFHCDQLLVRVFDSRAAMGDCAGNDAAACIKKLLSEKESINVMFAAAPSQNETLAALIADPDIDWNRINAFHMDEYVGLDPDHPAGFRNFLKRAIFDLKPFKSVNLLNGNAAKQSRAMLYYQSFEQTARMIKPQGSGSVTRMRNLYTSTDIRNVGW